MNNSGLSLTLDRAGFDETMRRLLAGVDGFSDVSPAIAELLEESVRRNFVEGGRPNKWPASKRAVDQAGYGNKTGQTLIDNSILLNSFTSEGDRTSVRVGTNVDYAAAHNFGVDKEITQQVDEHLRLVTQAFGKKFGSHGIGTWATVKEHTRKVHLKLPQREFMLIQAGDGEGIHDIITIKLNKLVKGN
ncbi:MAG: phage virion morphogenesis protein [uncultured bacterium]|nr:MAG: phage virion morphogenesis protein [uncultured bacterium]